MKHDVHGYLLLAPATLHILIALAGGDLHGCGIMQEVARQSEGRYKIGPGTLYDNLQRLTSQRVVMDVDPGSQEDSRRRYYRLTSLGLATLSAEINRLEAVNRHGQLSSSL